VIAFGVFGDDPRPGARVGETIVDLRAAEPELPVPAGTFSRPSLNAFMALGRETWKAVRERLHNFDTGTVPVTKPSLHLPFEVADYVDFYSSRAHAENMGRLFRPDTDPLPPNWLHLPIGYHGRSGTVVVSGTSITRPKGQLKVPDDPAPTYGPTRRLDIELELGFVIGTPSRLGEPVPTSEALDHVFGVVLVNDWSARDIQAWEYQPLGPFLGKSFATSISPWVVPLDELERVPGEPQDPPPLDYLRVPENWALDIDLEVRLNGAAISRTNARHLYWNVEQQVAHLTANGATLRTGDLLASGTISGPTRDSVGSLIELTRNGAEPLELADGTTRTFLEDGDDVTLSGAGLGEVTGRIVPARHSK
jgi:fumarylacetoacetase